MLRQSRAQTDPPMPCPRLMGPRASSKKPGGQGRPSSRSRTLFQMCFEGKVQAGTLPPAA